MTNSDQDENETQPAPEVEDPITNPGKPSAPAEPSAEDIPAANPKRSGQNSNSKWMIVVGVLGVLIVILMMISGSPEEGGIQNTDQPTNDSQTQGDVLAEEGNQNGSEGAESSEGGVGLPVVQDSTLSTNTEGAVNEGRVLDSIQLETNITVSSNEELIREVTDILVLNDRLGPNDVLSISSEGEINGNRVIRLEQTHQGIPVYGGVVIAIENNGNVSDISGATGNDIDIDIEPSLSYEEAIVIAGMTTEIALSPRAEEGEAELLIVDVDGTYHLAWYSVLLIVGVEEGVFLDAHDGSILLRLSIMLGEA